MANLSEKLGESEACSLNRANDSQRPSAQAQAGNLSAKPPAAIREVHSADGVGSLTRRDEAGRHGCGHEIDRFDVVTYDDDPWDSESAEALTKVYEDTDASLRNACQPSVKEPAWPPSSWKEFKGAAGDEQGSPVAAGTASQDHHSGGHVGRDDGNGFGHDRDWLEQRFADIAARLDRSLGGARANGAVDELGLRFAKLEDSLREVMAAAATRADVSVLRTIELQVEDLANQIEAVQSHFSRLDGIEQDLRTLADRVSDEKLARLLERIASRTPDANGVADVVANRVAEQMPRLEAALQSIAERVSDKNFGELIDQLKAKQPSPDDVARHVAERLAPQFGRDQGGDPAAHSDRLDELRSLIDEFVNERRHGDEQTNTMLDTMQQAMIRLLDRMDALELTQPVRAEDHPYAQFDDDLHSAGEGVEDLTYGARSHGADRLYDMDLDHAFGRETELPAANPSPRDEIGTSEPKLAGSQVPDPTDEASDPLVPVADSLRNREEFIASARRAARRAAAGAHQDTERKTGPETEALSQAGLDSFGGSASKKQKSKLVGLSGSRSRLSVALWCLIAVGAGFAAVKSSSLLGGGGTGQAEPAIHAPAGISDTLKGSGGEPLDNGGGSGSGKTRFKDADDEIRNKSGKVVPTPPPGQTKFALGSVRGTGELPPISGAAALAAVNSGGGAAEALFTGNSTGQGVVSRTALTPSPGPQTGRADADVSLPPAMIGPYSLRTAAANGNPSAQFEVGARFAEGKGVQQNLAEAVAWYQRSASKGFAPAQYRLGSMYERGLGVKADIERAKIWYQRSAEKGVVKAMHNLAVLNAGRDGAPTNYEVAARWFKEASAYGLTDSQFNLATMYATGLGITEDAGEAYKWFSIAARAGDDEASKRRDGLRGKFSRSQLRSLDAEVESWRPKIPDSGVNDMRLAGESWKRAAQ
ncbi:MAG: tetratricopeptide repeat protein [Hyphomicrobiaceae bacterium]